MAISFPSLVLYKDSESTSDRLTTEESKLRKGPVTYSEVDSIAISGPANPPPVYFNAPPDPEPNIMVESPLQRADDPRPFSKTDLVRSQPQDANPNVQLPQEILDSMVDYGTISSFYNHERPLDLMRFKGDKFWNKLQFSGFYQNVTSERDNLPFIIEFPRTDTRGTIFPQTKSGTNANIADGLPSAGKYPPLNGNFLGSYRKEIIRLVANPSVFYNPSNDLQQRSLPELTEEQE